MAIAKLLLKNDVGLVLDITESPLGCTVYDLNGNEIGGGGGSAAVQYVELTMVNNTGSALTPGCNYLDDDGYMAFNFSLGNGETKTIKALYQLGSHGDVAVDIFDVEGATLTLSDAVNCELESTQILRTADGPSSATLTLS